MSNNLSVGQIKLYNNDIPVLSSGNYEIIVEQNVGLEGNQKFTQSQKFVVQSSRFTIDTNSIHSVFPSKNSFGDYNTNLPFIVLNNRTLPWEHSLKDQNNNIVPWLALVVFKESELLQGTLTSLSFDNLTKSHYVVAKDVVNQTSSFLGPSIENLTSEENNTECQAILISKQTFDSIIPSLSDLNYTAHIKEVPCNHKTLECDEFYSTIISNRLCVSSGNPERYIAHLISVEGFSDYLEDSRVTPSQNNIALISMASWVFTSEPAKKVTFRSLMNDLVKDKAENTENLLLKIPSLAQEVEPIIEPFKAYVLSLDGSQYATLPGTNFSVQQSQNPFTIEIYAQVSSFNAKGSNVIFSQWKENDSSNSLIKLSLNNGIITFTRNSLNKSNNSSSTIIQSKSPLPKDEWHHIAVTYDGNYLSLYINGIYQDGTNTGPQLSSTTVPFLFGTELDATGNQTNFFDGKLALIRVWSVARTKEDIRQSLGKNITNNPAGWLNYIIMDAVALKIGAVLNYSTVTPTHSAAQKTANYINRGYIPRNYETRSGEKTFSWYRGPLVPVPRSNAENRSLSVAAEEETIYDPKTGLFDLSYSVAWETGRLLALSDKSFAVQLLNWRKEGQHIIDLLIERLNNKYISNNLKDLKNVDTLRALLEDKLLSKTYFSNFIKELNNKISANNITNAIPNENNSITNTPTAQTLLQEDAVKSFLKFSPGWTNAFESITEWLGRLSLLYGVPFENVVPDQQMLPVNSIRFFYLDQDYIDSMIDGALSVGTNSSKDTLFAKLMRNQIREAVFLAMHSYRDALLGVTHTGQNDAGSGIAAGFLIRSSIVSDWPGLEIKAYASLNDKSNGKAMKLIRFDRISSDVMLCLLPAIPETLSIQEPSEAFQFALSPNKSIVVKNVGTMASIGNTINNDYSLVSNINAENVLNINTIAQDIAKNQLGFSNVNDFKSAAFAFQLIGSPQVMDFDVSLTKPVYQNISFANLIGESSIVQQLSNQPTALGMAFIGYRKAQPNTASFYLQETSVNNNEIGMGKTIYRIVQEGFFGNSQIKGAFLFNGYTSSYGQGVPSQLTTLYQYSKLLNNQQGYIYYYTISNQPPYGFDPSSRSIICYLPEQDVINYNDNPFVPVMVHSEENSLNKIIYSYLINRGNGHLAFYASEFYRPDMIPVFIYEHNDSNQEILPYIKFSLNIDADTDGYVLKGISFFAYPAQQSHNLPVYSFYKQVTDSKNGSSFTKYYYSTESKVPKGYNNNGIIFYAPLQIVPIYKFIIHGNFGMNANYLNTSSIKPTSFTELGVNFYAFKEGSNENLVPIYLTTTTPTNSKLLLYRYTQWLPEDEREGYDSKPSIVFYAYPEQTVDSIPLYEFSFQLKNQPKEFYYSINRDYSEVLTFERVAFYVSIRSADIKPMLPVPVYVSLPINVPFNVSELTLNKVAGKSPAFYAFLAIEKNTVPVYFYVTNLNPPNGLQLYYYSTEVEYDRPDGYLLYRVQFYAYANKVKGSIPIYQFSAELSGHKPKTYFYSKKKTPPNKNFKFDKIAFYVPKDPS